MTLFAAELAAALLVIKFMFNIFCEFYILKNVLEYDLCKKLVIGTVLIL